MAYEVEPIAPSTSPVDASFPSSGRMREDKVFEPYKVKAKPAKSPTTPAPTNQADTPVAPVSEKAAEPAAPAESVALSPAMAALARKEQAFLRKQAELETQKKAIEAEKAEIAELKALKAKLAAKDFSGIEEQVPYEDYVNYLISKKTAADPQSQELQALKKEIEGLKEGQKKSLEERMADAVAITKEKVKGVVESGAEFTAIKKLKLEDAVVQHILDSWEEDEVELTPEQAAKEVESLLKEEAKRMASIFEPESPPKPAEEKQLPPLKPGVQTLTNNMAPAGEAARPNRPYQGMSDSERWAEARRRAEAKLKALQKTA